MDDDDVDAVFLDDRCAVEEDSYAFSGQVRSRVANTRIGLGLGLKLGFCLGFGSGLEVLRVDSGKGGCVGPYFISNQTYICCFYKT